MHGKIPLDRKPTPPITGDGRPSVTPPPYSLASHNRGDSLHNPAQSPVTSPSTPHNPLPPQDYAPVIPSYAVPKKVRPAIIDMASADRGRLWAEALIREAGEP
jgi:hypothetical protein